MFIGLPHQRCGMKMWHITLLNYYFQKDGNNKNIFENCWYNFQFCDVRLLVVPSLICCMGVQAMWLLTENRE
jgi:hypothetical protein